MYARVAEQIESMGAEFLMLEFEEDGSGEAILKQLLRVIERNAVSVNRHLKLIS